MDLKLYTQVLVPEMGALTFTCMGDGLDSTRNDGHSVLTSLFIDVFLSVCARVGTLAA